MVLCVVGTGAVVGAVWWWWYQWSVVALVLKLLLLLLCECVFAPVLRDKLLPHPIQVLLGLVAACQRISCEGMQLHPASS